MLQIIKAKIDVTKIDKTKLFEGKKGKYLDVTLLPTTNSQYNDDYMVVQDVGKDARERGEKGPILGNARIIQKVTPREQAPAPAPATTITDGDIPF